MAQGSGLTRADRNRNRKLAGLRRVVSKDRAVLAVDLGEDKQATVLVDHEGRVLARRTVKNAKAYELAGLLEWMAGLAPGWGSRAWWWRAEPTGHRWKALMGLADAAGHGLVCVQSLAVHKEQEKDDYTRDKTDQRDAYLIGKLVTKLECYLPERASADWARLRHLGARRFALVADVTSSMQQAGDLLGCASPAPLAAARRPLESVSWLAAMAVVTGRCNGTPARLRTMGYDKFWPRSAASAALGWQDRPAQHRPERLGRADRHRRGRRAAARRAGTTAPAAGGLAVAARPAGRD